MDERTAGDALRSLLEDEETVRGLLERPPDETDELNFCFFDPGEGTEELSWPRLKPAEKKTKI